MRPLPLSTRSRVPTSITPGLPARLLVSISTRRASSDASWTRQGDERAAANRASGPGGDRRSARSLGVNRNRHVVTHRRAGQARPGCHALCDWRVAYFSEASCDVSSRIPRRRFDLAVGTLRAFQSGGGRGAGRGLRRDSLPGRVLPDVAGFQPDGSDADCADAPSCARHCRGGIVVEVSRGTVHRHFCVPRRACSMA